MVSSRRSTRRDQLEENRGQEGLDLAARDIAAEIARLAHELPVDLLDTTHPAKHKR
jgi:hypothetical protein